MAGARGAMVITEVQVDMALLRTPTSPFLSSHAARAGLSSRGHGGGLGTRREEAQRRAGGVRLRSNKVCCARASVGEDRRDDTRNPRQFPPPVRD